MSRTLPWLAALPPSRTTMLSPTPSVSSSSSSALIIALRCRALTALSLFGGAALRNCLLKKREKKWQSAFTSLRGLVKFFKRKNENACYPIAFTSFFSSSIPITMHVAMTSRSACLTGSNGATASRSRAKTTVKIPRRARSIAAAAVPSSSSSSQQQHSAKASPDIEYDAIVIGSGMGGLTTASQLAAAGQRVAVLER